jgi:opacity protein-like surface antigen
MVAPTYDWTGFFFGGYAVYNLGKSDSTAINTATGALDASGSVSNSSFQGGGQVGFDYMLRSRVVIGFVANLSSGDDNTTTFVSVGNQHTEETKTTDSGSVRARLGYAFANILLYGTGGWAWTDASAIRTQVVGKTGNANPGIVETVPASRNGWTAGAGLAYGFWHNWELFGEYRYTTYQSNTATFPLAQRSVTSTLNVSSVTGGVNFKFDPFITRW